MKAPRAVIAEDEGNLREELRDTLACAWPELRVCAEAEDGFQALAALERHAPDVLFLDIQMPGMSGLEVARKASGKCHVVFVTAYDNYAVSAFEHGAVDYVMKPLSAPRLAQAVQRVRERLDSTPANLEGLLAKLAEQVDPDLFWQIHRGTLVNVNGIAGAARAAGSDFLLWYMPGMALQFASAVLVSGLRGTGIVKPTMLVQIVTVVLNAILAPILVVGWGTGKPLGVAGAGLATTIAVAVGVLMLVVYFMKLEHYVKFDRAQWRPNLATWKRLFNIGLPAGGEFGVMAIFAAVVYWAARGFGTPAQGGIGIGPERVRETFGVAVLYGAILVGLRTALAHWLAEPLVRVFTKEPAVVAVAVQYVVWMSWNFVPVGLCLRSEFRNRLDPHAPSLG